MTTCLAIRDPNTGRVSVHADHAVTYCNGKQWTVSDKIIQKRIHGLVSHLLFTGDVSVMTYINHMIPYNLEANDPEDSIEKVILETIVYPLQEKFTRDDEEPGYRLIIVTDIERIFVVDPLGTIVEMPEFAAVGSGEELAWGAYLYAKRFGVITGDILTEIMAVCEEVDAGTQVRKPSVSISYSDIGYT